MPAGDGAGPSRVRAGSAAGRAPLSRPGRSVLAALLAVTVLPLAACTSGGAPDPAPPSGVSGGAAAGVSGGAVSIPNRSSGTSGRGMPGPGVAGSGSGDGPASGEGGATAAGRPDAVPPADLAAIRAAVDAINAAAGGEVAAQRAVLGGLVIADQAARQRDCPIAATTLRFQPAYRDLRPAPDYDPAAPSPGTAYLLPTFITIYTAGRITGSDMTTLHLWVSGGVARTEALCVS